MPLRANIGKLLSGVCLLAISCSQSAVPESQGPASKVVVLAPSLAEIIDDFGGGSKLVGISSYGPRPTGAPTAKRVGGFTDPSIEKIISLGPDLVIGVPLQGEALISCRDAGLRTLEVSCESMDQALDAYQALGKAVGLEPQAAAARKSLDTQLKAVRDKAHPSRPRTLFLLGLAGEDLRQVFPVGPDNFADELLTLAGGQNVLKASSPTISAESAISLAPEVIIEVAMDTVDETENKRLRPSPFWGRLGTIPAVRDKRVFALQSSALLVPGPRMAEGAELLVSLLHKGQ